MVATPGRFQIAHFQAGQGLGRIGLLPCPGLPFVRSFAGMPRPYADLGHDLETIREWGAVFVISVIDQLTLDELKVPGLGEAVQRHHLGWLQLSVADDEVLDATAEEIWAKSWPRIRTILEQGQNVLLHCRSGRGPAAMMAARILVGFGWGADNALAEVRRVLRGAIGTPAPEAAVRAAAAAREDFAGDVDCRGGSAARPKLSQCLQDLDTELDLPMENELRLLHSEEVPHKTNHRLFSYTAETLLRPLTKLRVYEPSHLEWVIGLKLHDHTQYRYLYIFDRGYRFQRHLDALDASEADMQCISVVGDAPKSDVTGVAQMLRVRDCEEQDRLARISPLFEWLAKASHRRPFEQTWAYFFGR